MKISLFVVSAVFCFALGITFQASMPEDGIRSLASAHRGPTSSGRDKYDARMTQALRDCVSEKAKPQSLDMSKVIVDGRDWAIVSVDCSGEHARALYEAVIPYSTEQYVRYSDGRRGVARFFGRLYPPSQCVRVISASRGSEANLYACSIRMDLDHELIENLKL